MADVEYSSGVWATKIRGRLNPPPEPGAGALWRQATAASPNGPTDNENCATPAFTGLPWIVAGVTCSAIPVEDGKTRRAYTRGTN